jgi:hypothetical protein
LLARFSDDRGSIQTTDTDVVPLLYAAANLMNREDLTPDEIKETFESFISMVVMKQAGGCVPPSLTHPFETTRAVMVETIDELMPVLRPMDEFDAIVASAGGEDALKMELVRGFHGVLLKVLNDAQVVRS